MKISESVAPDGFKNGKLQGLCGASSGAAWGFGVLVAVSKSAWLGSELHGLGAMVWARRSRYSRGDGVGFIRLIGYRLWSRICKPESLKNSLFFFGTSFRRRKKASSSLHFLWATVAQGHQAGQQLRKCTPRVPSSKEALKCHSHGSRR